MNNEILAAKRHSPLIRFKRWGALCGGLCVLVAASLSALPPKNVQVTAAGQAPRATEKPSVNDKDSTEEGGDSKPEARNDAESGTVDETTTAYYSGSPAVIAMNGGSHSRRALLVFSSSPEPKLRSQMQEDLAVMHHLLDKNIQSSLSKESRTRKAMGVDLFFSPEAGMMQTAYFEGYGAFFLFRVDSPLLPTSKEPQPAEDSQPRNSAWEEAKQEVFGQPMVAGSGGGGFGQAPVPYDEEKVNGLKSSVLEALKNAANIRALKADEGVTVCLIGGPKQGAPSNTVVHRQRGRVDTTVVSGVATGRQRSTIMTFRAKKADVEAFASGKMNLDEFRRHASVGAYEGEPQAAMGFSTFGSGGGYGTSFNFK